MEEKLDLNKKSFNKFQYKKVINTKFSQLATSPSPLTSPPPVSPSVLIDNFFQSYKQLFFDIPKTGATNSHEYLIKTSTEYIDFKVVNDEILALIEEINSLQKQNLELNQKLINIQVPKV
jgi:hypothetical protein